MLLVVGNLRLVVLGLSRWLTALGYWSLRVFVVVSVSVFVSWFVFFFSSVFVLCCSLRVVRCLLFVVFVD